MKNFVKDYIELWSASMEFYRKHWLGVIMIYIASFTIGYMIPWAAEKIDNKIYEMKRERLEKMEKEIKE